ncbi:MAG: exopolysaccharide biosynthesis protein [Acidobacteriota bacterium]
MTATLRAIVAYLSSGTPTFSGIVDLLHDRGHAMVALMFSIIFIVPLGVPGLSTVLGAVVGLSGAAMLLARRPWLPMRLAARKVPAASFARLLTAAEKVLRPIERISRPRWAGLSTHPLAHRLAGGLIVVCASLLALPLPPGTNAPPAAAIVLLAVGVLEEDGLFLVLGWVATLANLALFVSLGVIGLGAIRALVPG